MNDSYGAPGGTGGGPARPWGRIGAIVVAAVLVIGAIGVGAAFAAGALRLRTAAPAVTVTVTAPAPSGGQPGTAPAGSPAAPSPSPAAPSPSAATATFSLATAEAQVRSLGYTPYPNSATHWSSSAALNVILGTAAGSADGYNDWAFFFADGRYLGTDTKDPSAGISIAWTRNSTIALTYELYHPNDPMCCPSAGTADVRYHWTGTQLVPLDPIPGAGGSNPTRN